jgi:drug/metabolite transporter (DMT)-like permease
MSQSRPAALHASATVAFAGVVGLGGINAVAIRVMNEDLAPLWGATLRFAIAAAVLVAIVLLAGIPLPRGRALAGSIAYGAVGFAGAFGCFHWALVHVAPPSAQTILALVPLLTLLLASGQGLERVRPQSLAGALVAFGGIAIIFGEGLGAATPLPSLAAVVAGAVCLAESNVILKWFPKCHPLANLGVAMTVGAAILLVGSLLIGESRALPTAGATWGALAYVSIGGSVGVFSLFTYVVQRWTASAASYVMLLMPLVTIVVAAGILGSSVSPTFLLGGAIVLAGVYVGALRRRPGIAAGPTHPEPLVLAGQPGCS